MRADDLDHTELLELDRRASLSASPDSVRSFLTRWRWDSCESTWSRNLRTTRGKAWFRRKVPAELIAETCNSLLRNS
jgi:hypothetical protein